MALIDIKRLTGRSVTETIASADFAVLPTGSVEWHGPHLPLGTDTLLAEGFAGEIASGNWSAVLYPTVALTAAPGQTRSYPGTIGIRADTMVDYYIQVLEGILASGFRRILIINAHDANQSTVHSAMEWVSGRTTASLLLVSWFQLITDEEMAASLGTDYPTGHGGSFETSGLMAFAADTVDLSATADVRPRPRLATDASYTLIESHASPWFGWSGNISQASEQAGSELRQHAANRLRQLIGVWLASPPPEPPGSTR